MEDYLCSFFIHAFCCSNNIGAVKRNENFTLLNALVQFPIFLCLCENLYYTGQGGRRAPVKLGGCW